MSQIYNISFGKKPSPGFIPALHKICEEEGIGLVAAIVVEAPGCSNLGIKLAEANDRFVEQLTMILMPAKYQKLDSDPWIKDGVFVDHINNVQSFSAEGVKP